jgi:hypothetical protein
VDPVEEEYKKGAMLVIATESDRLRFLNVSNYKGFVLKVM